MTETFEAFRREVLAEWLPPSTAKARALWIACWLETTCEAFDRAVCTGGAHPEMGAQPATGQERSAITRHARDRRLEAGRMAAERGIASEILDQAIREASRLRPAEQAAIVARPLP